MTQKNEYYKIGQLLNPLQRSITTLYPQGSKCRIVVPARVDTFLCHHHYFVHPLRPQVYPVNSINFVLNQLTEAEVAIRSDKKIVITALETRKPLIEHVVKIMQQTLGFDTGFSVIAKNNHNTLHGGLGSSSTLMTAVAQAINIIMGNHLTVQEMTKLLAQNYGEETNKTGMLSTMASIGGASASALSGKSLIIIGGEAEIWIKEDLPVGYEAVLLYPKNIKAISGIVDMQLYKKGFELFERIGYEWGDIKENILRSKIIPAICKEDYSVLFKSINMYTIGAYGDIPQYFRSRWLSHNIFFDEFIYTIFLRLFAAVPMEENCFFVSSGGPLLVIITNRFNDVIAALGNITDNFSVDRVSLARSGPQLEIE